MPDFSVYIHVPFCAGVCDYCDFYSVPITLNDKRPELFVEKILKDCETIKKEISINEISSIYIGGGTPSVLGTVLITKLLNGLKQVFSLNASLNDRSINNSIEITLEANPESCNEKLLIAAKDNGVTRVSIGVQTFNNASRRAINRAGEAENLSQQLKTISEIFLRNFSADLISGLPFQNETILKNDIEKVLRHDPGHVSLYALTLEPGTPLAAKSANGIALPSKDVADKLWLCGRNALEESGYAQYEISNFCVPGKESRHNMRYWRMRSWIGIGPSSSGTIFNDETGTAHRFTNCADVNLWLNEQNNNPLGTVENIDALTLIKETFLMGLRTIHGPDIELFKRRFKNQPEDLIHKTINKWQSAGLFQHEKTALTKQGLLFLDAFLIDAFLELEQS